MLMALELADLVDGGDAAGRRHLVRGGGAQAAEPVQVGALHHAFLIDVGAEEAAAVRLQPADHFFGA